VHAAWLAFRPIQAKARGGGKGEGLSKNLVTSIHGNSEMETIEGTKRPSIIQVSDGRTSQGRSERGRESDWKRGAIIRFTSYRRARGETRGCYLGEPVLNRAVARRPSGCAKHRKFHPK